MIQQLHKRRPQPQRLHVIGIIQRLDQLLEVVKGDHLVLEIDVGRVQGGHGGLHQVGVGGPAEEGGEDFGVEAAGGGFDGGGIGVGGVLGDVGVGVVLVGGGVLDAPFEEADMRRMADCECGCEWVGDDELDCVMGFAEYRG